VNGFQDFSGSHECLGFQKNVGSHLSLGFQGWRGSHISCGFRPQDGSHSLYGFQYCNGSQSLVGVQNSLGSHSLVVIISDSHPPHHWRELLAPFFLPSHFAQVLAPLLIRVLLSDSPQSLQACLPLTFFPPRMMPLCPMSCFISHLSFYAVKLFYQEKLVICDLCRSLFSS